MSRPDIGRVGSAAELDRWYWLRRELVAFARSKGLPTAGSKPELQARLGHWLDTGEALPPRPAPPRSGFDWRAAPLGPDTVITEDYRNTENVRRFMRAHAGDRFRFSNELMAWMRANAGRTLGDAVAFHAELERRKREEGHRERPLPQNEYNAFCRALREAVPGIAASEQRRLWRIKRAGPGPFRFAPGDERR